MLSRGTQNKKSFEILNDWGFFSFGDSGSGWKLLPWHSWKENKVLRDCRSGCRQWIKVAFFLNCLGIEIAEISGTNKQTYCYEGNEAFHKLSTKFAHRHWSCQHCFRFLPCWSYLSSHPLWHQIRTWVIICYYILAV